MTVKVLLYKDNISTGRGADFSVRNLASMLAEAGMSVVFVTRQPESVPFSCAFDPRVRILHSTPAGLVADIARQDPDAVIATGTNEAAELDACIRTAGVSRFPWPMIVQIHINPPSIFKWRHPFRNLAIKRALRKAAVVQTFVPSFTETIRRVAALGPRTRTVAIGNICEGVNIPEGVRGENLIVYPAALNPGKRQDLLIRAFARLAGRHPDWAVELYGTGREDYRRKLEALVRANGLEGRVRLMGFTRELGTAYARAAFIAFPSAMEGFAMVVIEAMKAGRPIVGCRRTTGVNELVEDGRTGLLVGDSPAEYAAGLERFMADADFRRRCGAAARGAAEPYSRENIARQWAELLGGLNGARGT